MIFPPLGWAKAMPSPTLTPLKVLLHRKQAGFAATIQHPASRFQLQASQIKNPLRPGTKGAFRGTTLIRRIRRRTLSPSIKGARANGRTRNGLLTFSRSTPGRPSSA